MSSFPTRKRRSRAIRYLLGLGPGRGHSAGRRSVGDDARHQRPARPAPAPERPWSPPAASATSCGSAIRTAPGCSIWRSASPSRCSRPWSRSTSGSPPTARCSRRPTPRRFALQLAALRRQGIESLAVCLLHAYRPSAITNNWSAASPRSWALPKSASPAASRRW